MKKCLLRKASIGIYNEQLVLKCERYRTDSTHLLGKCKLTNPMLCYVQDMAPLGSSGEPWESPEEPWESPEGALGSPGRALGKAC